MGWPDATVVIVLIIGFVMWHAIDVNTDCDCEEYDDDDEM